MDAHGALDSLLGRLASILVDEAQLLGGIRGDVEFIKEEMECMNSLILQITEAQHRDHLVRAWMKQVIGLARDCEGNVEHYIYYIGANPGGDGLLGCLRRLLRFLRTIPVRHRLATRIKELKVRARDVGERRQRYGVTVPTASAAVGIATIDGDVEPAGDDEDRHRKRAVLFESPPVVDEELEGEVIRKGMDTLIKWLKREQPPDHGEPQVRVVCIVGDWMAGEVACKVYEHPSVSSLFGCKENLSGHAYDEDEDGYGERNDTDSPLAKILDKIACVEEDDEHCEADEDVEKLTSELQQHLKGKRFLIVIDFDLISDDPKRFLDALFRAADGCHAGSAIMIITAYFHVALSHYPYKIINATTIDEFCTYQACKLGTEGSSTINGLFALCKPNAFAMKMFLHLLYVNPNMTQEELQKYINAISDCKRLNKSISKQVVMFCYNELPSKYRSCLLYLTIYPQGHIIRTTSLARRWVAEGLISTTASHGKQHVVITNEAEQHLDVLFTRGFVTPVEIGPGGDIKSFTLHHKVREVINKIARDVNFVETSQPTELAQHLSIHNRIRLQNPHSDGHSKDIVSSLSSLGASSQWQLLKVLDLEDCKGLKKKHLNSICKILLLRYLSLRNTDVTELPKQIKNLQCLETLDIRQSKVRVLANKPIVLPLLKHFLAGHKVTAGKDTMTSEESFAAVSMPLGIQKMRNIEILSHIQVTNKDSELSSIAQLLKLRKLGVSLRGKDVKLSDLFFQIKELQCLRSLSIRIVGTAGAEGAEDVEALPTLPEFIERLNICGITSELVHSIQDHHQLAKTTLSETYLKEDYLHILGNLGGLRCLRLQHKSYTESELTFEKCEFKSLNYLLVEGEDITKIRFAFGAAPKLEWIVWTFKTMDALSGIDWLPRLKKLELNGNCDLDPIKEALEGHPNNVILEHKTCQQRQGE